MQNFGHKMDHDSQPEARLAMGSTQYVANWDVHCPVMIVTKDLDHLDFGPKKYCTFGPKF